MVTKKIGVIVGSNRPKRICLDIAKWLQAAVQNDALEVELIDLAEINLPFLDEPEIPAHNNYQNDHIKAWSQKILGYDGFIFLFPQYNWGYPAVLKNALDYLYVEWAAKPVSIICYGSHGGFQGAMAMRLVTQGLKMQTMSVNIPIDIENEMFDSDGQLKDAGSALDQYSSAAQLLSQEFVSILS